MSVSAPTGMAITERVRLRVNGEEHDLIVPVNKTLLEVLREDLALTGTKHGCELGECGTCTVLIDGEPHLSCLVLPVEVDGKEIDTVEGLATNGKPHELQIAFAELGASQCGYCTPGIMMSARALLDEIPRPSRNQIKEYLAGNLCRCTGYLQILDAIEIAAGRLAGEDGVTTRGETDRVPIAESGDRTSEPTPVGAE